MASAACQTRMHRLVARAIGVLAICVVPCASLALDGVTLTAPGASTALTERLRAASVVAKLGREGSDAPEDLLAAALADYKTLTGVLYGAGHYGGMVSIRVDGREATTLSPLRAPGRIGRIEIEVDPGPLFSFGAAQVRPQAQGTELPAGFAPGQPAEAGVIREAAVAGVAGWRAAGHAKATLAGQSITANHAARRIDADLRLSPGPKLAFAAPTVSGNARVRSDRIVEIAGLPEGQTYSPAALDTAAARLRRTGAFRSVALREGAAQPDGTLPVEIEVTEAKRRRLGVGLELSSLEGVSVSGFWLHRFLRGGGERLRFDLSLSQIGGTATPYGAGADAELSFRFQRPATFTPDTDLFVEGGIARTDDPNFLSRRASLGFGVEHIFSERLTGVAGLMLGYYSIDDPLGQRDFTILGAPVGLVWDSRDMPQDATGGLYLSGLATPFIGVNGTANGVHLELDARSYRSFGAEGRVVLAGRAQLGSLIGPDMDDVPPEMLFFAGGGGTVRGHVYQSLGVDRGAGRISGGRSFLGFSAELRAKVTDAIGIVAFADTGYIGADSLPGDTGEWITGAGLGARYATPIGPLRLDLALPVSGGPTGQTTDASDLQVYIGIGQAF